jgi:NRAMP (natural resistance-associated macrophage protein)-like metal ion transporter
MRLVPSGVSLRELWVYTGPGWLMSLAYLDPGNLESDVQNGSLTGYSILWVLMWSMIAGLVLQCLAAKLGVVTGKGLAETCRDQYPTRTRYTLWAMTEIAIIGADCQEVLGSSIAWNLLTGMPLWAGVLVTALDTVLFLSLHYFGFRPLEVLVFIMILIMLSTFWVNMASASPSGRDIVLGCLNFTRTPAYAVALAVGTIGAVIMPHNLYLHSSLVLSRDVDRGAPEVLRKAYWYNKVESAFALIFAFLINVTLVSTFAAQNFSETCAAQQEALLPTIFCAPSELQPGGECCGDIGLSSVGSVLAVEQGEAAKIIWGVGLLASGQATTMTGTLAGQFVMEGFLDIRLPAWQRLAITRSVALLPAVAVAVLASGNPHLTDTVSQGLNVLQSVQLPFALLPLLTFTSDPAIMKTFVNTRTTQLAVWALALALIAVNFLAVFQFVQDLVDGHAWVWLIVALLFASYFAFICYVARPGLVLLRLALCGAASSGRGAATSAAPPRTLLPDGYDERGLGGPPLDRVSLQPVDAAIGPERTAPASAASARREVAVA